MGRQRVRTRTSPLAAIGSTLLVIIALALIWYGLMVLALALNVLSSSSANNISGYRSIYDHLSTITRDDITSTVRLITAATGLLAFAIFGYLAWKAIPRPYLTRHVLDLSDDERGTVTLSPRVIERVVEGATRGAPGVSGADGRFETDEIAVSVRLRRSRDVPEALREVQRRAVAALERHGLPALPVNVTLSGYDRTHQRELK